MSGAAGCPAACGLPCGLLPCGLDLLEVTVVSDGGHGRADRRVDVAVGEFGRPQRDRDGLGEERADLLACGLPVSLPVGLPVDLEGADLGVGAEAAAGQVDGGQVGFEEAAGRGQAGGFGHHQVDQCAQGPPAGRGLLLLGLLLLGLLLLGVRVRVAGGGQHQEPPEVAWLLPELELGAEPELKPLELDPEFVPVLELEPELVDEPEPELVDEPEPELVDEPVPEDVPLLEEDPELVDEPVLADVDDVVVCVDPGRARVTTPAATTLAMVTAVVVERTLARPRSRAAMARRMLSRSTLLMSPILRPWIRSLLQETSRLAMRGTPLGQPLGPRLPSEDEGHLKPRVVSGRRRGPDQRAG